MQILEARYTGIKHENLLLHGEDLPLPSVLHCFSMSFLHTER